ncbi:MAG: GUN4 N-terminal ARM-like repeat domain-containing protein [Leptolyngbyaceae cyanobacterium bins.302]|nr:GUN4 N-terminal ARM-like repeat domain-containing protein [Leptolyngbyaceae cyanobacterium bins.302]
MNSFSTDSVDTNPVDIGISSDAGDRVLDHLTQLDSTPAKNLPALIAELAQDSVGQTALMQYLQKRCQVATPPTTPTADFIAGKIYQTLFQIHSPVCMDFLQTCFPTGIVPLRSQKAIDYHPLQILLAKQDFQAADQLTLQKLCELAGESAVQRKWIYFTEVEQFPAIDLQTINALWLVHSDGKFGFSVQRELWLSLGKNWDKLWSKIGWKDGNNWTRYPQGFTWDLSAPKGHLPLSNQLRGVRVIASLMAHPAWNP